MNQYKYAYRCYKKLPTILAISLFILIFVCSLADIFFFSKPVNDGTYLYGFFASDSLYFLLFVCWAISSIISLVTYVLTAIIISPIIIQTDLLLQSKEQSHSTKNT